MTLRTVHIQLRGTFRVTADTGTDLTPRGRRAIGLLALLAEPDDKTRSRRWLEDKLWSDRAAPQAQGSLRSALNEIKKALADCDVLLSDRNSVSLDAARITTDLRDAGAAREFLEGLDIPDPEFNHWLSEMRLKYPTTHDPPPQPPCTNQTISIHCRTPMVFRSSSEHHASVVCDQIGNTISDFIALSERCVSEHRADIVIEATADQSEMGGVVRVRVIDTKSDQILKSGYETCENLFSWIKAPSGMSRFCWNVADAALDKLARINGDSNPANIRTRFTQDALSDTLSFDSVRMQNSLKTLDDAFEHLDTGLFLALKAWALTSLIVEDRIPEDKIALEEVADLLRRASRLSPSDPMVMALSASTRVTLLADYGAAQDLASQALRHNPNNLIAVQAMSAAQVARRRYDEAHSRSCRALHISRLSKFEARAHLHHGLLCITMGRIDEAIVSLTRACEANSQYRAPRRQLLALAAVADKRELCAQAYGELKRIEPTFSLDRFIHDETYHTHTLRRAGILQKAQSTLTALL